jgi:hypothetical protein
MSSLTIWQIDILLEDFEDECSATSLYAAEILELIRARAICGALTADKLDFKALSDTVEEVRRAAISLGYVNPRQAKRGADHLISKLEKI